MTWTGPMYVYLLLISTRQILLLELRMEKRNVPSRRLHRSLEQRQIKLRVLKEV